MLPSALSTLQASLLSRSAGPTPEDCKWSCRSVICLHIQFCVGSSKTKRHYQWPSLIYAAARSLCCLRGKCYKIPFGKPGLCKKTLWSHSQTFKTPELPPLLIPPLLTPLPNFRLLNLGRLCVYLLTITFARCITGCDSPLHIYEKESPL